MTIASHPVLTRRSLLFAAAAAATPLARATNPIADGRPITLVVSYPAGGGADLMARLIAPHMAAALGQSVIVDNRPGASGQLAANMVARAKPDGTTLLLDASSFAVNPSLFGKLPYNTATAFTPLSILALYPNVLVCTPGFEAQSVKDVLRLARARPKQLAFASSGNGSAQHLAGVLFEQKAHVDLLHVPYRGGGPALNDVMAGQVPLFFANVASSLAIIRSGKLRPLAVTSLLRCRALPDVPTMQEAGVPGYEVQEWNPVLGPAGLAPATTALLQAALRTAMADPEVLGRVRSLGGEVFPDASDARVRNFLQQQEALWARITKEHKISVD